MECTHDRQQGTLRLDLESEQLWREAEALRLRPKSFAVLRYLVQHAGRLVRKEELMRAIWPDTAISDGVLAVCMNELRQALGDAVRAPEYVETVPRRGYRWIGPLLTEDRPPNLCGPRPAGPAHGPLAVVGREAEYTHLHAWFEQARRGTRQVGFITGEAGIGKTTLADTFLAQVASEPGLWLARGQCIDHYGAGEPYLPVLHALGQLCREPGSERLVSELAQHAPSWLLQMPGLLSTAALEAVQRRALGTTRESMLRNLAEAMEALTAERLLVLVLEDLHWSDTATLDLVAYLARRREPARFLLLCTYRSGNVIAPEHPLGALTLDLQLHGQCAELPLERLTAAHVTEYLAERFGAGATPTELAPALHRRTDGHPLFLVTVVRALVQQGVLQEVGGRWELTQELTAVEEGVPESLRQLIVHQFARLNPADQRVVEAASVAGMTCTAAAVAAGVAAESEAVEVRCEDLAQRCQFLRAQGVEEWPDGTVTGRYGFRHTLYQQVIYEQIPVVRRLQLHQRLGARLEAGYDAQAGEGAAELAMHFECGRDTVRAVQYRHMAAENALRRYAYQEAEEQLMQGMALLPALRETPTRLQHELALRLTLGVTLIATKGYADPAVAATYRSARGLCQQVHAPPQLFRALYGLCIFYTARGEYQTMHELAAQLLQVAEEVQEPAFLTVAHQVLGVNMLCQHHLRLARSHLEQSLAYYDPTQSHVTTALYGQDIKVAALANLSYILWHLGYPEQARKRSDEAVTLALALSAPYNLGYALLYATLLAQFCREVQRTCELSKALLTLASTHGFPHWASWGRALHGWAVAMQGQGDAGITQLCQARETMAALGIKLGRSYLLSLLAEAYRRTEHVEAGLGVVAEALETAQVSEEWGFVPELYWHQGELLLRHTAQGTTAGVDLRQAIGCPPHPAAASFGQALAMARQQEAKSLELRVARSLARLWQQQGKCAEARALLAEVYGWFTEGFDTADLQEAKGLLTALSRRERAKAHAA